MSNNTPTQPEGTTALVDELVQLRKFLDGSGALLGHYFGDPSMSGAFWWRRYLDVMDLAATALRRTPAISEEAARIENILDWVTDDQGDDTIDWVTVRAADLRTVVADREKFMWQVRDTCARAEKAEGLSLASLLFVTDDKGFITLHEPNEDGEPDDIVASVWRDDYLPALIAALSTPPATKPDEKGTWVVDPQPEIVGAPICKIVSYNQAHEDAVEMGYPSLTEALEHLSALRASPGIREAVLEEAAKVADRAADHHANSEASALIGAAEATSTSGREVDLEYAVGSAKSKNTAKAIAAAIRALKTTGKDSGGAK